MVKHTFAVNASCCFVYYQEGITKQNKDLRNISDALTIILCQEWRERGVCGQLALKSYMISEVCLRELPAYCYG